MVEVGAGDAVPGKVFQSKKIRKTLTMILKTKTTIDLRIESVDLLDHSHKASTIPYVRGLV